MGISFWSAPPASDTIELPPARLHELCRKLQASARKDEVPLVNGLIEQGAPADLVLWGNNASLLAHCLGTKRFTSAQALLDAGADPMFPMSKMDEIVDGDWRKRLREVQTGLDRAVRHRQWDWVDRLLDIDSRRSLATVSPISKEALSSAWEGLSVSMVIRNAPVPLLDRALAALERNGGRIPFAELFSAQTSMLSPSREVFDYLWSRYAAHPQSTELSRVEMAKQVIFSVLHDPTTFESSVSSPEPRFPKGQALGWLISSWWTQDAPRTVEAKNAHPRSQLKEWAGLAVGQGQSSLLRHTLLPLLPAKQMGSSTLNALLEALLETSVRLQPTLNELVRHWGADRVNQAWGDLDKPEGTLWKRWLSRSGVARDAGTLELAQALASANILVPKNGNRSWLEDCFSTGQNVLMRFGGARGVDLLKVLIAAGAEPFEPNLHNKTPEQVLTELYPTVSELSQARSYLAAYRMECRFSEQMASSPDQVQPGSRAPRL